MKEKQKYSRREFLATSAKGAAVISAAGIFGSDAFGADPKPGEIPEGYLEKQVCLYPYSHSEEVLNF